MGLSKEFRVNKIYTEETKKKVVFRVLSGELLKIEARREYGILGSVTLNGWMEKYGHGILSEHKELLEGMGTRKKKEAVNGLDDELGKLRLKLKQAEKRADDADLRAEAYSLMIDIAEKELKIAIRKKSGTK